MTETDLQKSVSPLTLVIPAYNEAESLALLLPELIEYAGQKGWEIIIVDDGSRDETSAILVYYQDEPGLRVVRHKLNRGYGGALKTGIGLAVTEFVVSIDADGQHQFTDIDKMFAFMVDSDADMVVGCRESGYISSFYRRIGKWVIRTLTKVLVPNSIRDLNSGFKMYRTHLAKRYLTLCPDSMAFSDVITLVFISRRHLVLEYPVHSQGRIAGKSTINTYTALDTLFEILNIIMLFNPMKLFLPISLACIAFGFLWGLPILF
jgi:glycosyltransferase involved in cell wall biosynthesis